MTSFEPTAMRRETNESAETVERLLSRQAETFSRIGASLRDLDPMVLATCARGSSDHAASFFKYIAEIGTGIPVASIGPSIASIYERPLRFRQGAMLSISQSGKSPDIVALQANARAGGALAIALVNAAGSPLAEGADVVVGLEAGPERSVAATKSFIAAAVASAAIVAEWTQDRALSAGLAALPEALRTSEGADWSALADVLREAGSVFVVGRGPAYAIAREAALKAKETSSLHAEAYSIAEMMHGPLQVVRPTTPILAFVPDDAAARSTGALIERLVQASGSVFSVGCVTSATALPVPATGHPISDAIVMISAYYRMIEIVARSRGFDPDRPDKLAKVTETH